MADKPSTSGQSKTPNDEEALFTDDELIDFDDVDNEDIDYLEKLGDMELKDLGPESLEFINTVIFGNEMTLDQLGGAKAADKNESKALVPAEEIASQDEDDIDSEEEKDILKGIRDEVENKVREEMKDEVQGYRNRLKALENKQHSQTDDEKHEAYGGDDADDMDPKLQEAIIKMNKLDRILRKKIRKEKEVKRSRLLLERRMRQEIQEMAQEGGGMNREIQLNTEKYLALAPPPSHSTGITIDDEEAEDDIPPLFQTQVDEPEVLCHRADDALDDKASGDHSQNQGRPESTVSSQGKSRSNSTKPRPGGTGLKHKKDFIKRNKQLAADSDKVVAMTDDEKKRLAELLEDVDDLPESENLDGNDSLNASSSFQVSIHPGEGFCPDDLELKNLTNIDARLKSIMPEEDYKSIVLPSAALYKPPSQPALFTRVGMRSDSAGVPEKFGERVLYDTKEERELQARLQSIEEELNNFKASSEIEDDSVVGAHLTDEQLDKLLDQCARNMCRTADPETPDLSARSAVSSRQSLMENPPKLSDDQLQHLLSEAHFPLSSRLLALRDDDEKMLEEEGCTEAIRAETWKAIKDTDPDQISDTEEELPSSTIIDQGNLNNFQQRHDPNENDTSLDLNKNMSANSVFSPDLDNNDVSHVRHDNSGASGDHLTTSSRVSFSSIKVSQSAHFNTSTSGGLSEVYGGLPSISQTNGMSKSDSYNENSRQSVTPSQISRENSDVNGDIVRLPTISAKSFLIHAPQGLNNVEKKDKTPLQPKQLPQMVRNDLSDMKLSSFSEEDKDKEKGPAKTQKPRTLQPKPPANI